MSRLLSKIGARIHSFRRTVGGVALHTHSFHWDITRPVWPPFYATAVFLPRAKVRLRNDDSALDEIGLTIEAREYDDPLGELPSVIEGWVDVHNERLPGPWRSGETRHFTITIPGGTIPRADTYAMRMRITHWVPTGTPEEELSRQSREPPPQSPLEFLARPSGETFRGDQVFTLIIFAYFRVEPLSSVLSFLVAVGTLVAALASLTLAVLALLASFD